MVELTPQPGPARPSVAGPMRGPFSTPKARFTLRRSMVLVAIVAVLMGGSIEGLRLSRRSAEFRAQAEKHSGIEQSLQWIVATTGPDSPIDISPGPGLPSRRFTARAAADFEASLKHKYERAARRPWLSVAPDPPGPE